MSARQLFNQFTAGRSVVHAAGVRIGTAMFYHRQNYAAAGQTQLKFFNETGGRAITNMAQAGQFPNPQHFAAMGLCVDVQLGHDRLGSRTSGKKFVDDTADPITAADELYPIIKNAVLSMTVGSKKVIDEVMGLDHFPAAAGIDLAGFAATTETAKVYTGGVVQNGVPHIANMFLFKPTPEGIPGGQSFEVEIDWLEAYALTGGGCVQVTLHGLLFEPGNN